MIPDALRRNVGYTFVGLLVGLLVVGVVWISITSAETLHAIRTQQGQTKPVLTSTKQAADNARQVARRIESCTTPGRRCYQRGQRQTAAVVGDINASIVAAAACATTLAPASVQAGESQQQLVDQITACVVTQLAHRNR
jgi:hypothetical protein